MPFAIGQNLGQYRIVAQLGQGGMATVYRAYHPNLDRYVAVKVLHTALKSDPSFITRFQREAQIVARLDHPHIVPIYDFAEHEGEPYLVMKFVEGETLKNWLSKNSAGTSEIVQIMLAVGSALTYAHEQGVLHRDIKPSNILIENTGTPFLADFGLARMASAGESTISRDMMLGTPQYISPEQAQGDVPLTAATDIYSMGVVLYELLVGRVPFNADTPYAILHSHIFAPLPLPSKANPKVPPAVEQVLLKALAKDPDARYPSALALAEAFGTAVGQSGRVEVAPIRTGETGSGAAVKTPFTLSRSVSPQRAKPGTAAPARPAKRGLTTTTFLEIGLVIAVVAIVLFLFVRLRNGQAIAGRPDATSAGAVASNVSASTPSPTVSLASLPTWTPVPSVTPRLASTLAANPTAKQATTDSALAASPLPPQSIGEPPKRPGGRAPNFRLLEPRYLSSLIEDDIRKYVVTNPDDPLGYFVLGIALYAKRGTSEATAQAEFKRGIKLLSGDAGAMLDLARRLHDAENQLRSDKLGAGLAAAHTTLFAYAYANHAQEDAALRDRTGGAIFRYASDARRSNNHADVLQAIAADTDNGVVYAMAALASVYTGRLTIAAQDMVKAMKREPDTAEVRLIQGIIQFEAKNDPRASLNAAVQATDAPPWVKEEAQRLLKGL